MIPIPSTRIAIVDNQGFVALAQRAETGEQRGMLELFGGKFEQGETPMAAAEREVFEEYGGPVDFINREPIICPPYEVTGSDYKPKRFVVHAFLAQVVGKPYQPVSTEHIPQSGIWVNPLEIPHMQNVTKASKLAIKSLVVLF